MHIELEISVVSPLQVDSYVIRLKQCIMSHNSTWANIKSVESETVALVKTKDVVNLCSLGLSQSGQSSTW